jgi:hypothetical protein
MKIFLRFWSILLLSTGLFPQAAKSQEPAKIQFTFENANLDPAFYSLSVSENGEAEYANSPSDSSDSASVTRFRISAPTRERIFELTKALNYFDGDFDYRKHRIAFSGKRTFSYSGKGMKHSTSFNWSENQRISELASIFEGIASTLEYQTKLDYLRRHDKLGLNAELAKMEKQVKSGFLKELQLVKAELTELANDRSIMQIARDRAGRLSRIAESSAGQ